MQLPVKLHKTILTHLYKITAKTNYSHLTLPYLVNSVTSTKHPSTLVWEEHSLLEVLETAAYMHKVVSVQ